MAIPNDPITREEQYLASMAGQEVDLPQPITRVEKYLAKASGMDVETPDPITREEKYLDAIAEGGGGGSSVTVEPLIVTQNGTTTAPSGTAYSPVTVDVPNPNYVETISGTLANPWGGYSASDIFSAALAKDITVYLTIHDNTNKYVLGLAPDADSATRSRRFSCVTAAASTSVGIVVAVYSSTGNLTRCENYSVSSGAAAVIESIESTTTCTLTIIHHPLPDNE